MCAPDPNAGARRAAEARQQAKIAKHGSESIKYWNRETTYKRGRESIAMGLSRGRSDAYAKALDIAHRGRKNVEAATAGFATKRYVDEGGGARRAGMNTLKALLAQTAEVEKATDDAFGRNMDVTHQALLREYSQRQQKNTSRLGSRPEWGAPVMMPPKDKAGQFLATLQTGLSIAGSVMSLGTTSIATAGGGSWSLFGGKVAPAATSVGPVKSAGGGFLSGIKSWFSDVRLKENISKVGKTVFDIVVNGIINLSYVFIMNSN